MKTLKFLCLLLSAGVLLSCKNDTKPANKITHPEATHQTAIEPATPEWTGMYSGTLPCGDCPGLKTVLTLKQDSTYVLSSQALKKEDEPRIFSGTFHLDKNSNIVTLDAEGDHLKFLVQEDNVKKLDKFGNEEQGGPAAMYILQKTR